MAQTPIFLINLDRSPDRLAFMQEQAERLGLKLERISAVAGTRGLPKWLAPRFVSETGPGRRLQAAGTQRPHAALPA